MNDIQLNNVNNMLNNIVGHDDSSLVKNAKDLPDGLGYEYNYLSDIYWLMKMAKSIIIYENINNVEDLIKHPRIIEHSQYIQDDDVRSALEDMLFSLQDADIDHNVHTDADGLSYHSVKSSNKSNSDWVKQYIKDLKKLYSDVEEKLNKNLLRNSKDYVKEWYCNEFPNDSEGEKIFDNLTFLDAYQLLFLDVDWYEETGVSDSVVRERIFKKLESISNKSYEEIYELWIK